MTDEKKVQITAW